MAIHVCKGLDKKYGGWGGGHLEMWLIKKKHMAYPLPSAQK